MISVGAAGVEEFDEVHCPHVVYEDEDEDELGITGETGETGVEELLYTHVEDELELELEMELEV